MHYIWLNKQLELQISEGTRTFLKTYKYKILHPEKVSLRNVKERHFQMKKKETSLPQDRL